MSRKLVIAEKPSVAEAIARAIGAETKRQDIMREMNTSSEKCLGHLVELAMPDEYNPKYAKWRREDLPILPSNWRYRISPKSAKQFRLLKSLMERPDVTSLVESLYEKKLITYPRTDSRYLMEDKTSMLPELARNISDHIFHEERTVSADVKRVLNGKKVTDHEALLPTSGACEVLPETLPRGEENILRLISMRLLEAVGRPFRYKATKVVLDAGGIQNKVGYGHSE